MKRFALAVLLVLAACTDAPPTPQPTPTPSPSPTFAATTREQADALWRDIGTTNHQREGKPYDPDAIDASLRATREVSALYGPFRPEEGYGEQPMASDAEARLPVARQAVAEYRKTVED